MSATSRARYCGVATAVLLAAACPVALSAPGVQEAGVFNARYLMQVFVSLLFVLACLLGLLYLLKRLHGGTASARQGIQVLASVKVGAREKILLLEAGESQLLVGVAAGSVRTLHVFEGGRDFDAVLSSVSPEAGA
ncbi:MAG: flagellar biosynthetic protein FliO [Halioglobus sp.]|nr:flagellar biosynthetic protein FliO [Halioglobus sp.]